MLSSDGPLRRTLSAAGDDMPALHAALSHLAPGSGSGGGSGSWPELRELLRGADRLMRVVPPGALLARLARCVPARWGGRGEIREEKGCVQVWMHAGVGVHRSECAVVDASSCGCAQVWVYAGVGVRGCGRMQMWTHAG
eukprot:130293-Chlamydomonas_euryale.AAC.1